MIILHRGVQRREITQGAEVTPYNTLKGFHKSRKRSITWVRRYSIGQQAVSWHTMSTKSMWLLHQWLPHLTSTLWSKGSRKQVRGPLAASAFHGATPSWKRWRGRLLWSGGAQAASGRDEPEWAVPAPPALARWKRSRRHSPAFTLWTVMLLSCLSPSDLELPLGAESCPWCLHTTPQQAFIRQELGARLQEIRTMISSGVPESQLSGNAVHFFVCCFFVFFSPWHWKN